MGVRLARDRAHAEKVTGNGWPAPALPPRLRPNQAGETHGPLQSLRDVGGQCERKTGPEQSRLCWPRGTTPLNPRRPKGLVTSSRGLGPSPAPLLAALRRSVAQPPAEQNDPVRPSHPEEPQVARVAAEQPR